MSAVTAGSISVLGILIFVLGANVTRLRSQRGDSGNQMPTDPADPMLIAIRAHGNAAEYVPTLIGLLLAGSLLTEGLGLDILAVTAALSRLVHSVGILTSRTLAEHGPLRDIGAAGTYLTGVGLVVVLILAI